MCLSGMEELAAVKTRAAFTVNAMLGVETLVNLEIRWNSVTAKRSPDDQHFVNRSTLPGCYRMMIEEP